MAILDAHSILFSLPLVFFFLSWTLFTAHLFLLTFHTPWSALTFGSRLAVFDCQCSFLNDFAVNPCETVPQLVKVTQIECRWKWFKALRNAKSLSLSAVCFFTLSSSSPRTFADSLEKRIAEYFHNRI